MAHEIVAPWGELVPEARWPMTAAELLAMPESARGYELVEGRLVSMSPTGLEHSDVAGNMYVALRAFVRAHHLGTVTVPETGFLVSASGEAETVLAPDVAYIRADRLPPATSMERRGYAHLAPDLVVEVASPSQYAPELAQKARLWLAAGVRLLWVVWPAARQVDVWRPVASAPVATLGLGGSLDGGEVVPGFSLPVAELFE